MKNAFIAFLLCISFIMHAQSSPKQLRGKTYDVYFMQNGNGLMIDSLHPADSLHPGLTMTITFPATYSHSVLTGKSTIHYYSRYNNDCGFEPQVRITSDSILLTTMNGPVQIFDPCEGHTDWADAVWEMFSGNVSATYIMWGDKIMITWDNGKKMLYLKPREMSKNNKN